MNREQIERKLDPVNLGSGGALEMLQDEVKVLRRSLASLLILLRDKKSLTEKELNRIIEGEV